MKRAPLVSAGTVLGVSALLTFHSSPSHITLRTFTTTGSGRTTTTTLPSVGVRSANGALVNYYYGVLSIKVAANGSKITNVSIASINDGGSGYSTYIDQQSIPILEHEVLAAQSANIQAVSGASYTSQGFVQSLQSALIQIGL